MKRMLNVILIICGAVAAAFLVFLLIAVITDYRPADKEILQDRSSIDTGSDTDCGSLSATLPDSVSILCWNIGYGGLGDDMDFFYDGGTRVRDTRGRTEENIAAIIREIRRHNADIVLLQEVDECSKRTYRINEVEMLRDSFPDYHIYLAYNYKSFFVPIPVKEPIGKVASGVVLMSRFEPDEVCRWQYPSKFSWPTSMFNLKRCLLTATYTLADGRQVVIGNTHNTAYDTGNMRTVETDFLSSLVGRLSQEPNGTGNGIPVIIGGDWNQYPASYTPSARENDNPHFSTVRLDESGLSKYGRIIYDPSVKTLRHLNTVYGPESVLTVTDFFFVSDNIHADTVQAFDLQFRNSDHHPVLLRARL